MKKIYLLFFCFTYLTFAQNDDPANGTLYQPGGKIFEAIGLNDSFYRFNISFVDSTKEFSLRRIEPILNRSQDSIIIFTIFEDGILRNRLKKLFPGIDSLALNTLNDELNINHHKYNLNKLTYAENEEINIIEELSFKNVLIKNSGNYYESIIKNQEYKIKLSYDSNKNQYKVEKTYPLTPSNQTDSLFKKIEEKIINFKIHKLFEKDFEFNGEDGSEKLVDSLNLYKLAINFYNQIQRDKRSIEEKKSEKLKEDEINKAEKKFEKLLEKEKRNIGKIGFRKNPKELSIIVYNWETHKPIGFLKVKNAQIAFGDGVISKININGTFHKVDGQSRKITFYNVLPPIPIRTREQIDFFNAHEWEDRYWLDAQYYDEMDENESMKYYIYLSDVLFYEQNLIYNYGIYIPPDGKVITLDDSVVVFNLRKESFVNDFDLRIYTDITGLNADNPNGLIKFMGNYNLNLNTSKFDLKGTLNGGKKSPAIWFNYANLFFNFNKIESDELVLPIKPGNDYLYSTSFDLYRYTKFELGIDLNIISFQYQYSSISFNLLLGTYHTPVDSTFQIGDESVSISEGVNSFYTGLKLNYKFFANEYVDLKLGYSFILPQLFSDNKLKEISGPIDNPDSEGNTRNGYFDYDFLIHRIDTELSIFSDPQDRSSFIFLKAILNFNSSDNYISLLLGYTLPFSSIFAIGQATR